MDLKFLLGKEFDFIGENPKLYIVAFVICRSCDKSRL